MTTAEQLAEYVELSNKSINLAEAKNNLSQLISGLTADTPVLLNVRSKPRAAIIDIRSYIELLSKAEAYEHIRLADEADAGKTISIEEGREYVRQRRAEMRAAREAGNDGVAR